MLGLISALTAPASQEPREQEGLLLSTTWLFFGGSGTEVPPHSHCLHSLQVAWSWTVTLNRGHFAFPEPTPLPPPQLKNSDYVLTSVVPSHLLCPSRLRVEKQVTMGQLLVGGQGGNESPCFSGFALSGR